MIVSLLNSIVMGGLIGFEREYHHKAAGLRSNLLVTTACCALTILSTNIEGADPARLIANILTGIGFLGAGVILRSKGEIRGITTATIIWMDSCIGIACGLAKYEMAWILTAFTLAVAIIAVFEKKINGKDRDFTD